ncbi:MAG: hypothetical protein QOH93_1147 [Chloroflexia bacterium]|jgi:hypothetical protein|nr:hypothetical protein [Chloroflexia bacterium]
MSLTPISAESLNETIQGLRTRIHDLEVRL